MENKGALNREHGRPRASDQEDWWKKRAHHTKFHSLQTAHPGQTGAGSRESPSIGISGSSRHGLRAPANPLAFPTIS